MIKINKKQRLYIIPEGKGYTCLGFDVCKEKTVRLWRELRKAFDPLIKLNPSMVRRLKTWTPPHKGTHKAYEEYIKQVEQARSLNQTMGYRFTCELEPRLIGLEGKRVQVEDKKGNKRRFYVGKSTGFIPVHLEISKRNSSGGPAVCLFDTDTIKVVGER